MARKPSKSPTSHRRKPPASASAPRREPPDSEPPDSEPPDSEPPDSEPPNSEASGSKPSLHDGVERPRFLLSFPPDPQLDQLVEAFEKGDYWTVRQETDALIEKTDDEDVREAALELRERIEPDPLMRYLLVGSVVLLIALTFFAYHHGHH